jgi:hypothetical protein
MSSKPLVLLPIFELSKKLGIHPQTAERYLFKGVLVPDTYVSFGSTDRPLFKLEKLEEYRTAIADYKQARRDRRAKRMARKS